MKLFVSIYNDARLLGHFLRHYRAIGVTEFFIAGSVECRGEVERRIEGHPVTLFDDLDVTDIEGTVAVSEMRRLHQGVGEWVVIVDLDEFLECSDVPSVAASAERTGANVVRGIMHDRFSADGHLRDFSPDSDLSEVYAIKSRFIREIMKGCDHKGVLVKGHLNPTAGAIHHRFDGERVFREVLEISHYKWIAGSIERLRRSHRIENGPWAAEYQRALNHFDAYGRFAWETFGGRFSRDFTPEPPAGWCADCGAAVSEAEREFSVSAFGRPLCRTDQSKYPVRR